MNKGIVNAIENDNYISRQVVKWRLYREFINNQDTCVKVFEVINDIRAADVRPVKRGAWVEDGCMVVCNQCHEQRLFPHWIVCPGCGADMRQDGKDGDACDAEHGGV